MEVLPMDRLLSNDSKFDISKCGTIRTHLFSFNFSHTHKCIIKTSTPTTNSSTRHSLNFWLQLSEQRRTERLESEETVLFSLHDLKEERKKSTKIFHLAKFMRK